MGVGLLFLRQLNLFLAIGAGAVLYLILLFAFRAVERDELRQLLALLLRREE
jgi:hypothetical protein